MVCSSSRHMVRGTDGGDLRSHPHDARSWLVVHNEPSTDLLVSTKGICCCYDHPSLL